ncbi:MAG TPA: hypothetical protein VK638_24895 [Edaphobacter sp.]|nr:hypothetical protein [Edaphobacter sp.]
MRLPIGRSKNLVASCALLLAAVPVIAQDNQSKSATPPAPANAEALRKKALNPVSDLISFPLQENWNFGIQPGDRIQNVLNVQPVIPVDLTKDWNLVIRWIAPIVYQPVDVPQQAGPNVQTGYYGLGDMQPAFFFTPKVSKVIWAVGPQLLFPTATKTGVLGQGKFGLGPTAAVLAQPGKWTLGVLVNNVWSVAGNSTQPDVNQFLLQYFINYNLNRGWYLTWQPTLTANWEVADDNRWVVPFGGGVGRIMRLGAQPVNLGFQFYGNAVHPPDGSTWTMRLQIAFLFPTGAKKK